MFRETRAATHQFSRTQREHVELSWVFAPSPLEDEVVLSACSEVRRAENHVVRICLWEEIGALKSPCQLPHPFPREWWASMKARGICLLMKGEWHQGCLEGRFTFESVFPVERGGFPCAFSHSLPFLFFFFGLFFSPFLPFLLPAPSTNTHTHIHTRTHTPTCSQHSLSLTFSLWVPPCCFARYCFSNKTPGWPGDRRDCGLRAACYCNHLLDLKFDWPNWIKWIFSRQKLSCLGTSKQCDRPHDPPWYQAWQSSGHWWLLQAGPRP